MTYWCSDSLKQRTRTLHCSTLSMNRIMKLRPCMNKLKRLVFWSFFKTLFILFYHFSYNLNCLHLLCPPPPNMVKELYLIKMYFRKIMKLRNSNCKALNLRTKERKFSKSWRNSNWCALKKPMNIPKRIKKYLKFLINSEQVGCKLTNLCLN